METTREGIKAAVRQAETPFTSIGGYPIFSVMADTGIMCPKCVKENRGTIYVNTRLTHRKDHLRYRADKWWTLDCTEVNWEDPELFCDECSERIPSAYAEDQALKED